MAAVHIGNVVEFYEESLRTLESDVLGDRIVGCDAYASMAPFYTTDPGVVVIPGTDQSVLAEWAEIQVAIMAWTSFEPLAYSGDSSGLSLALHGIPAVRQAVAEGQGVVSWGETPAFRLFVERSTAKATFSTNPAIAARIESKLHHAEVFDDAADDLGRPNGLRLAEQQVAEDEARLVDILVDHGTAGHASVLKTPSGSGGDGCAIFRPHQTATRKRALSALAAAREADAFLRTGPLLVQRFYPKRALGGDLTSDFEIDAEASVSCWGTARMILEGTHYAGALTLSERTPEIELAEAFGYAVGERLAADGYRGWFDIDFLRSPRVGLVPVEINARRTGPTVPFTIQSRIRALSGAPVEVAAHDLIPLGARMTAGSAIDHFRKAVANLDLVEQVVPTLTTATESLSPYLGVAVLGETTAQAEARLWAVRDEIVS